MKSHRNLPLVLVLALVLAPPSTVVMLMLVLMLAPPSTVVMLMLALILVLVLASPSAGATKGLTRYGP